MAFSRTFLKSLGLEDDKVTAIMEEHVAVTDALKKQRDDYRVEAEKIPEMQKEIDTLKSAEDFKSKYDQEHQAFEDYKTKVQQEAETEKVKAAYRSLLAEQKVNEKRLDVVMRATDFSAMKLDKDGKLENADALKQSIQEEWADFIVKTEHRGARVDTPPKTDNDGKPATRARELANSYFAQKYGAPKSADKE